MLTIDARFVGIFEPKVSIYHATEDTGWRENDERVYSALNGYVPFASVKGWCLVATEVKAKAEPRVKDTRIWAAIHT